MHKDKQESNILDKNENCIDCSFEEVVETTQLISKERYIPELNKFIDVCI